MKRQLLRMILLFPLLLAFCATMALAAEDTRVLRVGLNYGSTALSSANLENSMGSGYRFGYYDGNGQFQALGSTAETQISMLKTQTIYLKNEQYFTANPGAANAVIGAFHLQLPGSYQSFDAAKSAAGAYLNGFPAWISGSFYVRVGAYATESEAQNAKGAQNLSNASIVGTSAYGIHVCKTKTEKILFQFDGSGAQTLTVRPGQSGSAKCLTWFKGYKYYGDFTYERIGGGDITVVNHVTMDDYAKGVLPYEMSASWPLEALKAQAVAVKSYALSISASKHASGRFDVCNSTCCQVYRGANSASNHSDSAVEAVSGIYAWHQGKIAQTFYYSSNGGASEDAQNVWSSPVPYLVGVSDPYEGSIAASIPSYHWSVTYSGEQLATRLKARGYDCGSRIESFTITQFTKMNNVHTIELVDNLGKRIVISKERVRTALGLQSLRFQLAGTGSDRVYIDESGASTDTLDGLWVIGEGGATSRLSGATPYASTAAGTQQILTGGSSAAVGTFVLNGSGNGHNIGMSQYGANAMAKQGFSYQDILKFYYTGIDLY